jgi:hypothetical protein
MANYKFIDAKFGNDSPTATGTVKNWPLGMTAAAADYSFAAGAADTLNSTYVNQGFGEWQYVAGVAGNTTGSVMCALIGGSALPAGTAFTGSGYFAVGMVPAKISATSVYGWAQIRGGCDYGRITGQSTSVAANDGLYLGSTTGGVYTTAGATGYRIMNMAAGPISYTSSQTFVSLQLQYPFFNGRTANL